MVSEKLNDNKLRKKAEKILQTRTNFIRIQDNIKSLNYGLAISLLVTIYQRFHNGR